MNELHYPVEVYRGLIGLRENSEGHEALHLSDDYDDPVAERVAGDLKRHGRYATVRYWISDAEQQPEELADNLAKIVTGAVDADYGMVYSEYTGYLWTNEDLRIGGHDLLGELEGYPGKWAHLEIRFSTVPQLWDGFDSPSESVSP